MSAVAANAAASPSPPVHDAVAAPAELKNDILLSPATREQLEPASPQVKEAAGKGSRSETNVTAVPATTMAQGEHSDSPRQPASPAPVPNEPIAAGATVAAVAQAPTSSAAQPTPSVADQLTKAFVARAEVVNRDGRTNFHLRLEPPQLGTVQVHLSATDNTISARIVVAQEGTRQLLDAQAHHLRQSLAQAGVSLTGFDVTRDGGGSRGGQQSPPQAPTQLLAQASRPVRSTVVPAPASAPTDGINILA